MPVTIQSIITTIKAGSLLARKEQKWLKAHPNERNDSNVSPIHWAAHRGNREQIEQLIGLGLSIDLKDGEGKTPFRYAVSQGHIPVMELLINKGADPNSQCKQGNTPLHSAVHANQLAAVFFLLKLDGIDIHRTNNRGQNAYDFARECSGKSAQSEEAQAIGIVLAQHGLFYPSLPLHLPEAVYSAAETVHRTKSIHTLAQETFRMLRAFPDMGNRMLTKDGSSLPPELFSRIFFWVLPKEVRQFVNKDNPDAHPYVSVIEAVYNDHKLEELKAGRGENMRQFAVSLAENYPHTLRILKDVRQRIGNEANVTEETASQSWATYCMESACTSNVSVQMR